jgi:hypothetical protein
VGHMVAELGRLLADLRGQDKEIEEDGAPLEMTFFCLYIFMPRTPIWPFRYLI